MKNNNINFDKYDVVYTTSFGIYKNNIIRKVLLDKTKFKYIKSKNIHKLNLKTKNVCFIGWGKKENTQIAFKYCEHYDLDYIRMEDGFIRSNGLGVTGTKSMSFTIDKKGIFYDKVNDNDLKDIIMKQTLTIEEELEVKRIVQYMVDNKISKYNNIETKPINELYLNDNDNFLIIGQVDNDMSLKYGLIDNHNVYMDIIEFIKNENPKSNIYLKLHPDILSGVKKTSLDLEQLKQLDVNIITDNYNPLELLNNFNEIHTLTSQMGFEALMLGKKVHTWGVPFYSGYGITQDHNKYYTNKICISKSLEEVFKSMYLDYTIYINLEDKKQCNIWEVFDKIKYFDENNSFLHKMIKFFAIK
jgi:capsular polysaccharide export protein